MAFSGFATPADATSMAVDSELQYDYESEHNTCHPFDVMHPLFETHTNGAHQVVYSIVVWGKTSKPPTSLSENTQQTATLGRRKTQTRQGHQVLYESVVSMDSTTINNTTSTNEAASNAWHNLLGLL